MGLGAAGIIGVAIAGIGLKAAIEWESAFAGVRKTVEGTEDELQGLEDQLRSMAGEVGLSAVELAKLAETAGALGIKTADIAEFVRVTAMIGATTNVSADMAATSLGQLSNVLGLTGKDYEAFASTLVDLGNKGAGTEQRILEIATRAGGAADLIGLAVDQTLAWSSAVDNLGIETEAGGSSLQRFFLGVNKLTASDEGLGKLTKLTGLTADAFMEMWKNDPTQALLAIVGAMSKLDASARQQALLNLGFNDIRITRTLLGLAGNVDGLTESLQIGSEAWDANAALQVEFGKRAATTEFVMGEMRAALHEIAIIVGEALLPHFKNFVVLVKDVAGGIGNWMKANKGLVDTLTPILAVLSGILALKFGANFIGALLGQFGIGTLGRVLTRSLLPQVIGVGTVVGTAQGTAHATAATGPGVLRLLVTKIAAMQLPLAATGTTVGTAIGTAMALGIAAGIVLIGTHVIAEAVNNATNAAREKIKNNPNSITTADLFQSRAPAWAVKKLEIAKEMQNLGTEALAAFNAEWERGLQEGLMASDPALLERSRQAGLAIGTKVAEGAAEGTRLLAPVMAQYAETLRTGMTVAAAGAAQAFGNTMTEEGRLEIQRAGNAMAAQSALAAHATARSLAGGLLDSLPTMHNAWAAYITQTKNMLDPMKQIAFIEAKLAGRELAEGLTSTNPLQRAAAEEIKDILSDRLSELRGLMGNIGEDSGDSLGSHLVMGLRAWQGAWFRQLHSMAQTAATLLKTHSPAKAGPWSKDGGPAGWFLRMGKDMVGNLNKGLHSEPIVPPSFAAFGGALSAISNANGTLNLHHTVDIRGDASHLDNRKVADMLNEGASGFAWNLEHAMSAVSSG